MYPHHFAEALASAIRQLSLTPEEFARDVQLSTFETAHLLAGEPLPQQNYRTIFEFFLENSRRSHLASSLARACLADTLLEYGLDEETIEQLSAPTERDLSVTGLFQKLSPVQLLALSVIGHAAAKMPQAHDALLALAEFCRAAVKNKTISTGFFRHHMSPFDRPHGLAGSTGATFSSLGEREGM
jgi:hypothetical protein